MRKKQVKFDYGLLRDKIKDEYGTFGKFAATMGVSTQRISYLLTNKSRWTDELILKAARLLGIEDELNTYFFTVKVKQV